MHSRFIYLIAPICGWIASQLIKIAIERLKKQEIKLTDWLSSGNFPSTHVAGPMALLAVLFKLRGLEDPLFALGFLFTALVAYDSMGVRRTAAESAVALTELSKSSNVKIKPIHIFKGHSPLEVIAGGVVGVAVGLAVFYVF